MTAPEAEIESLFRREAGRMTAALVRIFGPHNLPLAEDVVHDALCRALETWKMHGMPEKPGAWLMAAAKNRALDVIRRERTARRFAADLEAELSRGAPIDPAVDEAFGEAALRDDQLRMMFACCHARLPVEAQVALMLNLLCGFGATEIAGAFLASESAIEKRLQRGKTTLAEARGLLEVTPERVASGIDAVQRALYLMFNEGYHGNGPRETVRAELCAEAIRLTDLLAGSPLTATPATEALLALMCLTAARLSGRVDGAGDLLTLDVQDRKSWNRALAERGAALLESSARGEAISEWHVEAMIAYEHTSAANWHETNWTRIVELYEMRMALSPSPVIALGRAIAVGEAFGPERGLSELLVIDDRERLADYPFYAAAVGEQLERLGRSSEARARFEEALTSARSDAERRFLERRLARLRR